MASRTQLRLAQVTGSLIDIKDEVVQYAAPNTVANLTGSDLQDVVGALAAAVQRIHGKGSNEVFNASAGVFSQDLLIESTNKLQFQDSGTAISSPADGKILIDSDGSTDDAIEIRTTNGAGEIVIESAHTAGRAVFIDANANAGSIVDIDAGIFDLDCAGIFGIDGVGASNVTTNGALTVSGSTGLELHSRGGQIDITSAQNTIDINAPEDDITIDAGAAVSIDAGAASNFTTSAGALTLAGATLDVDATGGAFNIAATAASEIVTSGGTLTVDGKTGVVIQENNQTILSVDDDRDVDYSTAVRNYVLTGSGTAHVNAGGVISIGNEATNANINIGTGGTRTVTIGEDGGATTLALRGEAANVVVDAGTNDVAITGGLTVSLDAVFSGDLTVLGSATEISSSNTIIKDALIVLNSSSYGDGTPIEQDAGIIFAQPNVSRALFVDTSETGDPFRFVTTYTSGSATSVTRLGDADVTMGGLTTSGITDSSLTDNHVVFSNSGELKGEAEFTWTGDDLVLGNDHGLVFGDAGEKIEGNGTRLRIESSDKLEFDVGNNTAYELQEAGTTFAKITNETGNALTLSSSLGPITLSSNTGVFNLQQFGFLGGVITSDIMGNSELIISGAQGNALKLAAGAESIKLAVEENELFTIKSAAGISVISSSAGRQLNLESNTDTIRFSEASGNLKLDFNLNVDASTAALEIDEFRMLQLDGGGTKHLTVSGSQTELRGGAAAHKLQFYDAGESHYVELKAPAITDNVELILPAADATSSGQALVSDGSGQLSFSDVGASSTRKGVFVVGSTVNAGANFDIDSADQGDDITLGGVDGNQGRVVDVFVNGQLMTSGSAAQRAAGDTDFEIKSTTRLLFAFALEADDIVTVVKRG